MRLPPPGGAVRLSKARLKRMPRPLGAPGRYLVGSGKARRSRPDRRNRLTKGAIGGSARAAEPYRAAPVISAMTLVEFLARWAEAALEGRRARAELTIRVVGTRFKVTLLPARWVRVEVEEGLVEVEYEGQTVRLGAGDSLQVSRQTLAQSLGCEGLRILIHFVLSGEVYELDFSGKPLLLVE